MTERKKSIVRNIAAYSSGRYLSQFLGFFIAVLMRNFLGPFNMGIWSIMSIVLSYSAYSEFGAMQAMYYKIPFFNGKGDRTEAETIKDVVFGFLIVTSILVSLIVLVGAFFLKDKLPRELFHGFLVFPFFFISQRVYAYYVMILKANKNFVVVGKTYIFDSAINLVFVVLLVSRFKIYGLYLTSIVLPMLDLAFMFSMAKYRLSIKFDIFRIKSYIRFGFPVFMSGFSMIMLYSIDRIMIAKMIGFTALGFYSIAVMTRTYTHEFSQNFASVLSPHFIEDYGKTGDISLVGRAMIKCTELTSFIMAVMLVVGYLVMPPFVLYFMPDFVPGITAMKIMIVCTFFIVISGHFRNFLVMKERQVILMNLNLAAIALNIVFNYTAIKLGYGINGVAFASMLSALFLFVSIALFAISHIEGESRFLFFMRIFGQFFYFSAMVFFCEKYVTFNDLLFKAVVGSGILLLTSLLPMFYVDKRTGLVGFIFGMIRGFLTKKNGTVYG